MPEHVSARGSVSSVVHSSVAALEDLMTKGGEVIPLALPIVQENYRFTGIEL